jgi:predicted DNA-binding transcriptional regulator YafY
VLDQPLPQLSVELQLPDLLALAMAQGMMTGQAGAPYALQAQQAFHKLAARLPAVLRQELSAVRDMMDFAGNTRRDYSGAPLQDLVTARRQSETVEMVYYSIGRDAVSTRQVDPYSLTLRNGYLNLVGYCHTRRDVLLFSLDGIRNLRLTGEKFAMPQDFSLAKYMEGVVGGLRGDLTEIVVRFEPSVARWARKLRWEFPHTLEMEADGALLLRGQVSGLEAIHKELLRWGAQVEALEPPALRQAMLCEALAIAAKYRVTKSPPKQQEK